MNLYILKIPKKIMWNKLEKYVCYISRERTKKIEKYISNHSKITSLLTEIFLRYCLTCFHNVKIGDIKFVYNENQKPSIIGKENLYFSISHSCNIIGIAVNDHPIGLDLEVERIINLDIAKELYSSEECCQIFKRGNNNIYKDFFKMWTQKESRLKLFGESFLSLIEKAPRNKCVTQTFYCDIDTSNIIISTSSKNKNLNINIQKLSFENVLENVENIR